MDSMLLQTFCVAFVFLDVAGMLSQWVQHTLAKAVQMLLTVYSVAP